MQAILEKFEFFPIKCRVQRALELYKDTQKRKENIINKFPMKQKVWPLYQEVHWTLLCYETNSNIHYFDFTILYPVVFGLPVPVVSSLIESQHLHV